MIPVRAGSKYKWSFPTAGGGAGLEVGTQKEVFTRNKTRAGVEGHYHP